MTLFGGFAFNFPHSIPVDEFPHVEAMNCPCQPRASAIMGFGGAICHNKMDKPPETPDTFPEKWVGWVREDREESDDGHH